MNKNMFWRDYMCLIKKWKKLRQTDKKRFKTNKKRIYWTVRKEILYGEIELARHLKH